jgi:hypothetical protein
LIWQALCSPFCFRQVRRQVRRQVWRQVPQPAAVENLDEKLPATTVQAIKATL